VLGWESWLLHRFEDYAVTEYDSFRDGSGVEDSPQSVFHRWGYSRNGVQREGFPLTIFPLTIRLAVVIFTRLSDMRNVLFPRKRWGSPRVWQGVACCLGIALMMPLPGQAQTSPSSKAKNSSKSSPPDASSDDLGKDKPGASDSQSKTDASKGASAAEPVPAISADPSQTRKIAPNEVFRDPKVEALLNVVKFPELFKGKTVGNDDILSFKAMAADPNANLDTALMERVIDAQIARLTDHANIQALLSEDKANQAAVRAIHDATNVLLEPLFLAKATVPKNEQFLSAYNRLLVSKLRPLLKNHLIPRIQAMIILGESGNPNAMPVFEEQIKDANQTTWVKLWAMEGISNIRADGRQLTGSAQIQAAKVVADFLDQDKELPWPAQLRALETLGAMRQGYLPNLPQKAHMANSAMRLLADPQSRLEVRAEAARALALMQITPAVERYNYLLVAHAAAHLAAELGAQIASSFATNKTKSEYYTGLLLGPVYQAFDGVPGARDAGYLHANSGPSAAAIQKVFDLVKPVAKTALDLIRAPNLQTKKLKDELTARVAELKGFLDKNPVADRHLVRGGDEYPVGGEAAAADAPASGSSLAGRR
jgi:hypothetical protein